MPNDFVHRGPRIEAPRLPHCCRRLHLAHPSTICSIRRSMSAGYDPPYANPTTEALNGRVARYVAIAGLTILLYDHFITMKEEVSSHLLLWNSGSKQFQVHLVWPGHFSLPKLLYYINRYLVIAFMFFKNYRRYITIVSMLASSTNH